MSVSSTVRGVLLVFFVAFFSSGASAKTLVYCSEASPEGFNPSFYTTGTTFDVTRHLFEGLVGFEPGGVAVVPGLASSWSVSADGTEYTFDLRRGVKFHTTEDFTPTRDFNADDVVFSFMRQVDAGHPYHDVSGGQYPYSDSMLFPDLIEDVVKEGPYTVKFILSRPQSPFLSDLAMPFAAIMSAEYAEKAAARGAPEQFDLRPVGTGPFQLAGYRRDSVVRFKAFPEYWGAEQALTGLVFTIVPDSTVRRNMLEAGECHVAPYPAPADLAALKENPDINLMELSGMNVGYLAFNTEKEPFTDREVRKALSMAIDKQAILDAVYRGAGVSAKNPLPPTVWSYNDDVVDYPYDPEAAREMLAEAGYPDGFKTDIWALPVQRPYNPNGRRMAEMIQADWAKVGVRAEIVSYEWGEYLERAGRGEHEVMMGGWTGDNGDPDNFLSTLLGCASVGASNYARWCDEEFDSLVRRASVIASVAERTPLYKEAQLVFKREAPWVTMAHQVVFEPVRKEVVGYKVSPFGAHSFIGVDVVGQE